MVCGIKFLKLKFVTNGYLAVNCDLFFFSYIPQLKSTIPPTNEIAEIIWKVNIDEVRNPVAEICASDCTEGRKLNTIDAACGGVPTVSTKSTSPEYTEAPFHTVNIYIF